MKNRRLVIVAVVVLIVALAALFVYNRWRNRLPEGVRYQAVVSAFYTGVLALNVNDKDHQPVTYLTLATQLAPMEPAAWADLGLSFLRKGAYDEAQSDLDRAHDLAPKSAAVEALLGLLGRQQGHYADAITHYQQAVALDPQDLRARYGLILASQQQAGTSDSPEVTQQYAALLAAAPDNLFVALEAAYSASATGEASVLRQAVARIAAQSAGFPLDAQAAWKTLQAAASGPDPRAAHAPVVGLRNLVEKLPQYQAANTAVVETLPNTQDAVGRPLEHFLVLPVPPDTPAPPDMATHFAPQVLTAPAGRWALARLISLVPEMPAKAPDGSGYAENFRQVSHPEEAPSLIVADGRQVRVGAATLPFPGGPAATPPTPDGVLPVDFDYSFRPGLVLAGHGGVRIFRQTPGDPASPPPFTDVTAAARLPAAVAGGAYTGAWAADVDLDGDLDVVLGTVGGPPTVLRNNGDGTFAVTHPFPGAIPGTQGFAWADLNGDGVPDAVLLDGRGDIHVFENQLSGLFLPWSLPPKLGKTLAVSVADVERRGTLDLVVLGQDGVIRALGRRPNAGDWTVIELARWPGAPQDGSARLRWADLDNNGAADLIATGSGGSQVWLTDAQGRLQPLASPVAGRNLTVDVTDNQDRQDPVGVSDAGAPVRLVNQGTKKYQWQIIRPRAAFVAPNRGGAVQSGDERINSFGVGGEMEMRAGLLYQKLPITGPAVHFGLGTYAKADLLRILWPNGSPQAEFDLPPDQAVAAPQRLIGSCPWLFADDGHGMKFITDFIWRSPLGLRLNAQATAGVVQTQDWVNIRGDQLAAKGGFYNLSITADLWETHFFDYLRLMTVDHPVGTNVSVDERFAVPPPPLKVWATTPPAPVRRATDDLGHDVTDIVRARDGRYLDTFGRGAYQGITRDHFVELDLGPAPAATVPQYLVVNGWIHPTDSSINVAISQGHHAPPQQMSLEVPDGHGGWRTARDKLGFPEGKNKTCLLDVTGLFRAGQDRRVRLRTNLEIYWDFLGTAEGRPQTPLRTQRLPPAVADLRYRGFSATHQANASSPEVPDYDTLAGTGPEWLDLTGYCTRFGDVRPLLARVDDRYVIMNAGDEMRLRFAAPPPPPAGWTRDFVLIGDGWEKDGNRNTQFSQTVLPLPSHARPAYDTPPGRLQDDPVYKAHRQDWQTYQTRYITPRPFHDALLPR